MATTFEAVRAEALFVWCLQSSRRPSLDEVREAVAHTLRRLGMRGCAALVADEFGTHPETAVARMGWALAAVRAAYPSGPGGPAAGALRPAAPLALAS